MLDKIAISSIYILLFYLQSKVVLQVAMPVLYLSLGLFHCTLSVLQKNEFRP